MFPALKGSKIATGPIPGHIQQVLKGKNAMPPTGSLFGPDEIEALWAYVVAGEKR